MCGSCSSKIFPLASPNSGAGKAVDSDEDSAASSTRPKALLDSISDQRVCDCCFNFLVFLSEGLLREPERSVSTGMSSSLSKKGSAATSTSDDAMRHELLGSSAASAQGTAMKGARASSSVTTAAGVKQGTSGIQASLGNAQHSLGLRGEKLSRLDERTAEMASKASNFADMAAQLKAKQSSWW